MVTVHGGCLVGKQGQYTLLTQVQSPEATLHLTKSMQGQLWLDKKHHIVSSFGFSFI